MEPIVTDAPNDRADAEPPPPSEDPPVADGLDSHPASEPAPEPGPASVNEPGAPPPLEVERDVASELAELDQASRLATDVPDAFVPTRPADPVAFDTRVGLSRDVGDIGAGIDAFDGGAFRPASRQPTMKAARTLFDLCASFDKLHTGEFWLRVERKHPKTHGGVRCAGWVENYAGPLDENGFRDRYGGGAYRVQVQGPHADDVDDSGHFQAVTLAILEELNIAGPPRLSLPKDEDEPMMSSRRFSNLQRDNDPVEKTRLEIDARRDEREASRADKLMDRILVEKNNPSFMKLAGELASERAEDIRQASAEAQATLRAANQRLEQELEAIRREFQAFRQARDEEVQKLRERQFETEREADRRANEQETARIRELKEQHERELASARRAHEDDLRRERDARTEKLEELHREHRKDQERQDRERRDLKESMDRERKEFRDEAARKEQMHQQMMQHQLSTERASFDTRLSEMEKSYQREIRNMREAHQQQLNSIQAVESTKTSSVEQGANMQVQLMSNEAQRLSAQNDSLQQENQALRDQLMRLSSKTPGEAIAEAKQLMDMVQGEGRDDAPTDWKSAIGSVLKNLTDKAPEIVEQVTAVRQQNQIAAAQQQQVQRQLAQQRQQQQLAQAPPRRPAPQAQQHSRQAHAQPPPGMERHPSGASPMTAYPGGSGAEPSLGSGVPEPPAEAPLTSGSVMTAPPRHVEDEQAPPAPPIVHAPQPPAPPEQPQAPAPVQAQRPPAPPPPQQPQHQPPSAEAQPDAPQEPASPRAPAEPEPEVEPIEIPEEAFKEFATKLDETIRDGLFAPDVFAEKFIERTGPDIARRLLRTLTAEQFVAAAEAAGSGSVIPTRKGRQYVRELWQQVARRVG